MILFIAPNPHKVDVREGFLQRVWAIDQLFSTEKKLYWGDLTADQEKAEALSASTVVYIHSIYQAQNVISSMPTIAEKVVIDFHGIVPEEEEFSGNTDSALYFSNIEKSVFANCNKFVVVTDAMREYLLKKYPHSKSAQWVVLPIFDRPHQNPSVTDKKQEVIYAGGTQPWQNVESMIHTIKKSNKTTHFTVLTHDTEAFSDVEVMDNVTVKSVKSEEVASYYKPALFGFILRDDIAVNRVACPTKLIEYLSYGVIPIIKSPNIGDFKSLGYAYTSPADLGYRLSDKKWVESAINKNYEVIRKLVQLHETGVSKLLGVVKTISTLHKPTSELDRLRVTEDRLTIELREAKRLIVHQQEKVKEYAEMVEYFREELHHMRNTIPNKQINGAIHLLKKVTKIKGSSKTF